MTKYLETKRNSIEEAISSVVLGEGFASDAQRRAAFAQGYKAKGKKDKNEELDEGTLSLPKSMKDFRGIVNLMKRPIKAKDAEKAISKFIDDGWIILKENSQEKICTWKSVPSTKDCDMEKDKGCKLTKPDKIGEEKIYLLEKKL